MTDPESTSPYDRLVQNLERGRRNFGRLARRDPQAMLGFVGVLLACGGVSVILLAWSGVAHSRYVQQQLAYAVSGGLGGLAMVIIGGCLYLGYLLVRHQRALALLLRALGDLAAQRVPPPAAEDHEVSTLNDADVATATITRSNGRGRTRAGTTPAGATPANPTARRTSDDAKG